MEFTDVSSRFFNNLTIDHELQTITKRSINDSKLVEEIRWYLDLPEQLKPYIPIIHDYCLDAGNVFVTMEYIRSSLLSRSFVQGHLERLEWERIFQSLHRTLTSFTKHPGELEPKNLEYMYATKTRQRLSHFLEQSAFAKSGWKKGHYTLNGRIVLCPLAILKHHTKDIAKLFEKPIISIIHGDFCFSNLLYNDATDELKLIDPRGSFGKTGIYGDRRYDLAKIRHSLSGYEHIVSDHFDVQIRKDELELNLYLQPSHRLLLEEWDRSLGSMLGEVKLIESLLFLSMLPLHRDRPDRQLAMYALGTQLLYEALEE